MLISALLNCHVRNIKLANILIIQLVVFLFLNITTSNISGYTIYIAIASSYTLCRYSYSYSYDVKCTLQSEV